MKATAIISEFNPFHNGHKYLIDRVGKTDSEVVIAIMSGDFTQRGETACFSKFARTEAALKNGVDMVVELPVNYALSGAQNFALGGVSLANSLKVETLAFGSECGDCDKLKAVAENLKNEKLNQKIKQLLKSGITYAAAREQAYRTLFGESDVLSAPNDILAIEYIREILDNNFKIKPIAIKRKAVEHDGDKTDDVFASASYIRNSIKNDGTEFLKYIPENLKQDYLKLIKNGEISDISALEKSILIKLRSLSPSDLLSVPDVSEGLENRILQSANQSVTLNEFYEKVKSKRYTLARIRRIILSAFLGIDNSFYKKSVPYIRVLGANDKGIEYIKSTEFNIPIVLRTASLKDNELFKNEVRATDTFNLSLLTPKAAGEDFTRGILKNAGL